MLFLHRSTILFRQIKASAFSIFFLFTSFILPILFTKLSTKSHSVRYAFFCINMTSIPTLEPILIDLKHLKIFLFTYQLISIPFHRLTSGLLFFILIQPFPFSASFSQSLFDSTQANPILFKELTYQSLFIFISNTFSNQLS